MWGIGSLLAGLVALITFLSFRFIDDRSLAIVVLCCGVAAEAFLIAGVFSVRRNISAAAHPTHESLASRSTTPSLGLSAEHERACRTCESLADSGERQALQRELSISREKLRLALECGTIGMWYQDLSRDEVELSDNLRALYGFEPGRIVSPAEVFARIHPDDQAKLIDLQKNLGGNVNDIDVEYRVVDHTGRTHWCVGKGRVLRGANGEQLTSHGVVVDVTDIKEAALQIERMNQQIQRQAAELRLVNEELESFSYSVSHDLRAPLRSINGFGQALVEDCAAQLDDAARDYLDRICNNARRMGELIDDLLALSRLSRWQYHPTTVNLTAEARSIVAELRTRDPARTVEITIDEAMTTEGDGHLLRTALQNLLENAWKYTAHNPAATIHFGRRNGPRRVEYFVADNGAGFDMTYAGKLFQPFQRLHAAHEFEGNGIGLATVRRIIQRHGGEVWAEGKVGRGAIISFTIEVKGEPDAFQDDSAGRGQSRRRRIDSARAQEEQYPQ